MIEMNHLKKLKMKDNMTRKEKELMFDLQLTTLKAVLLSMDGKKFSTDYLLGEFLTQRSLAQRLEEKVLWYKEKK